MATKSSSKTKAKATPKAGTSSQRAKHSRTPKAVAAKEGAKGLDLIRKISLRQQPAKMDDFRSGDTVNVFVKVKEGEKERVQVYKGVVTRIQGTGASKSFTVRKISSGIGVERTFPFMSPALDHVELLNTGHVRRSKLYYLRRLEGKAAKIQSDLVVTEGEVLSEQERDATVEPAPPEAHAPKEAKDKEHKEAKAAHPPKAKEKAKEKSTETKS